MPKTLKLFALIVAAALGLWFLFESFNGPASPQSAAVAFEWEKTANVYFSNSRMGSSDDCSLVFPLPRTVVNAETLGPGTIYAVLDGVRENESESGYFSNIPNGALLQRFEVVNGIAYVDFSEALSEEAAGSCRVLAIRSQIEKTLTDLPDIDSVIISVDGQTEGVLEP